MIFESVQLSLSKTNIRNDLLSSDKFRMLGEIIEEIFAVKILPGVGLELGSDRSRVQGVELDYFLDDFFGFLGFLGFLFLFRRLVFLLVESLEAFVDDFDYVFSCEDTRLRLFGDFFFYLFFYFFDDFRFIRSFGF